MASSGRWKRHEREIAAILRGMRIPNNGAGQPDVIAGNLAVQVKTKASFPGWLTAAVDQATRDAEVTSEEAGETMLPVVVLSHGAQGRKASRLAVLDLDHLVDLLDREAPEAPGPVPWEGEPAQLLADYVRWLELREHSDEHRQYYEENTGVDIAEVLEALGLDVE